MHAALVWIMVSLVHPVPYGAGYTYPSLAACQHAIHVFDRSSSTWTCRSITLVSDVGTGMPPPSTAAQLRGQRNAAYDEAKLHELVAHPPAPDNAP